MEKIKISLRDMGDRKKREWRRGNAWRDNGLEFFKAD